MLIIVFVVILLCAVLISTVIKIYQKLTLAICRSNAHMVGKVVIITGGNSGIGFETAKNLADRGARVIIACRNAGRGVVARDEIIRATGNLDVHYELLDLASLKSVRNFCSKILKNENRLDVLINNAAAGGLGNIKTEDGLHIGMQVNYFGPFLLTCLLIPLLKASAPSRIVNVSSVLHSYGELNFDNLNMEKYWSDYLVYANSKLYLNLMGLELSRRMENFKVTANALHPGVSSTNIFRNIKTTFIRNTVLTLINFLFQDPWEASQTSVYLAVSSEVENISGCYFSNCKQKKPSKLSQDSDLAKKLWVESEKLVKNSLWI